jgi:N6-L-threonylcarbamoyladenine synthase
MDMGKQMGYKTFIPDFSFCTDNAAMIAITGYYKFLDQDFVDLSVSPVARASW